MSYPVTYYCPRCETLVKLERDGYLADKTVTPYPLEGWTYVSPDGAYESADVDGVRFVCGEEGDLVDPDSAGCGEPFYLSFVRFEDGREIEPRPESEFVAIDPDPRSTGPRGPRGPPGPYGAGDPDAGGSQ